jgi:hypothetical protein
MAGIELKGPLLVRLLIDEYAGRRTLASASHSAKLNGGGISCASLFLDPHSLKSSLHALGAKGAQ